MNDKYNFLYETVEEILQKELKIKAKKLAVAVSGGCDSLALTLLLNEFCQKNKIELLAVTIDHKMRQNSSKEAKDLGKILAKEKISHQILTISKSKVPSKNIEAKLRELRYEMLYDFCQKNHIKYLFLGHILGDVAENFLIRLFRGSGLDGLSSIAKISTYKDINLIRPLLDVSKDDLKEFLKSKKIQWFEDETNLDEKFLRNKIRNFLESFSEKDLLHKRIKSASDEIAKSRDFLDKILLQEAKKILKKKSEGFLIDIKKFKELDEKIALKILALVLMEVGGKDYKPRLEKLRNFYEYLKEEKIKPRNFYNCMAKKFDEKNIIIFVEKAVNKNQELKTILSKIF